MRRIYDTPEDVQAIPEVRHLPGPPVVAKAARIATAEQRDGFKKGYLEIVDAARQVDVKS